MAKLLMGVFCSGVQHGPRVRSRAKSASTCTDPAACQVAGNERRGGDEKGHMCLQNLTVHIVHLTY